jgi:hypothetical protein
MILSLDLAPQRDHDMFDGRNPILANTGDIYHQAFRAPQREDITKAEIGSCHDPPAPFFEKKPKSN